VAACTRSPSGFVLEVTSSSDSSGHRVVAANPVDQNLCQYFVVTELPGQGSFTIANTAATGTFLEPSPITFAPPRLIASSRRFADQNQEWRFTFEENVNGCDYYSIESVRYPGNVLVLDRMSVKLSVRGQSSQPAVYQHWTLVPAGGPADPLFDDNQDDEIDNLMELQDLRDNVAVLKEENAEKDSLIKDKDDEINRLKELIAALSTTEPTVDHFPEPEVGAGQAATAVALYDYEATEDYEMSLVEGEYIKHIDQSDDGWWSGVGRGGKTGLFPSHFVRLLEGSEPPSPPEIPATHVGGKAVALYNYLGAEDNQVTFREGDIITDVVSERWLRGKSPSGEIGLFPAIYVDIRS